MTALIYMREDFASVAVKTGNTDGYPGTTKKHSPTHLSGCLFCGKPSTTRFSRLIA